MKDSKLARSYSHGALQLFKGILGFWSRRSIFCTCLILSRFTAAEEAHNLVLIYMTFTINTEREAEFLINYVLERLRLLRIQGTPMLRQPSMNTKPLKICTLFCVWPFIFLGRKFSSFIRNLLVVKFLLLWAVLPLLLLPYWGSSPHPSLSSSFLGRKNGSQMN